MGLFGIRQVDLGQYFEFRDPYRAIPTTDPIYVNFALLRRNTRADCDGKKLRV